MKAEDDQISLQEVLVKTSYQTQTTLVKKGFGDMMHACKTDWAMLVGSVFLLIKGGGHS